MIWLGLVPFVAAVVLAVTGRRLGTVLPPVTAVRLLTGAALVCALGMGFVLAVTAFTVLAQVPAAASAGQWSASILHQGDPLPAFAGILFAVAVAVPLTSALLRAGTHVRDLAAAEITCRRLGPATAGLVIVTDDQPDAYTLPGLSGRVVVSTGMLRALPSNEQRVLLAHEDSHLRHRHHLYVQLADLAAASNPLLRPTARAVGLGCERWADEDAAAHTGDRNTTARALARAALARTAAAAADPAGRAVLGAVRDAVAVRIQALLVPPPTRRQTLTFAVLALIVVTLSAVVATEQSTEHRFERAHRAFVSTEERA